MSEDIIEQIARAIYDEISDNFNLFDLDYATPPTWEQISEAARAMFRDVASSTCAMARRALAGALPAEQPAPPSLWIPIKDAPREDGKMFWLATRYLPDAPFDYSVGYWDDHTQCWFYENSWKEPDFCQPFTPPPEAT